MSRPTDRAVRYFPHDVGLLKDRKFRPLRRKYGYLAQMVYMILLEMIYGDKGYYLDYSDKDDVILDILEYLSGRYEPDEQTVGNVIDDLVAHGLLSPDHYRSSVLTSKRIQATYYKATVERKGVDVDPSIWMLSEEEMRMHSTRHPLLKSLGITVPSDVNRPNNRVNRPNNPVNRPNNRVNRPNNPQSKVEESKAKESKAEESKGPGGAGPDAAPAPLSEHDQLETILALIRDNICPVTSMIRQDISDWLRQMDAACVLYAVQEAARAGAKSTKYVYSILQRLLDDGATTPEAMEHRKGAKGSRMGFERDATPYDHYFDEEDET